MTGESGLNMNELHLADRAAGRVADEFRKAIPQLKDLRDWLMGLDTDMGMGACREERRGMRSWHRWSKGQRGRWSQLLMRSSRG